MHARFGQAATEYMIIVSIGLFLITPIVILGQNAVRELNQDASYLIAENAIDKMIEASNIVYSQGPPARMTIQVQFPSIPFESSFEGQMIRLRVQTDAGESDLVRFLDFNATGEIADDYGMQRITIEAIDQGVNITGS